MPTFQSFKDISVTFGAHPNTEDLLVVKDDKAIKIALQNLIMTKRGERPFNSQLGSRVSELLFDVMDYATASLLKDEITVLVQNYEPRIALRDVIVTPDESNNAYEIYIEYEIIGREVENATLTTEFLLKRTR
jgi:phage baseplate assembly protein W